MSRNVVVTPPLTILMRPSCSTTNTRCGSRRGAATWTGMTNPDWKSTASSVAPDPGDAGTECRVHALQLAGRRASVPCGEVAVVALLGALGDAVATPPRDGGRGAGRRGAGR